MSAVRFPIEAGHILMFARALGDPHADDTADQGVAPPTFMQCAAQFDPNFPYRPRPGQPWMGSGATPSGLPPDTDRGTGAHAEQHFEYLRHPRVGDVLFVTTRAGDTWEKQSGKGGKLRFSELIVEHRDAAGELYVVARHVRVDRVGGD